MAGFRTFIKNTADSLNVAGFADNLEDGSVRIVCEGGKKNINRLIKDIKDNIPLFVLEDILVTYDDYIFGFKSFDWVGADITSEGMTLKIITLGLGHINEKLDRFIMEFEKE